MLIKNGATKSSSEKLVKIIAFNKICQNGAKILEKNP